MQQANKAQEYVQNDMTEFQQAMEQAQQRLKTELQSRLEESRAALEKQTRSLCVLQHSRQEGHGVVGFGFGSAPEWCIEDQRFGSLEVDFGRKLEHSSHDTAAKLSGAKRSCAECGNCASREGLEESVRWFSLNNSQFTRQANERDRAIGKIMQDPKDIEHAIEGMKRELAKEQCGPAMCWPLRSDQPVVEVNMAAHSATSAVEATKEALQEQAKQKEELLKNFDTWKLEALEEAARRVLEAQEVAVGDLMKTMDRHRYQTKEDTLKTREELLQVMTSNNNLFDGKVVDLQQRLQLLAMEAGRSLGDLNGDLERLRRGDSTLQESTLDLTLPGLRDLRGAVTDEQKRRHQEAQRLGERLQEPGEGRLSQYQERRFPPGDESGRPVPKFGRAVGEAALVDDLDEPSHEEKVSFTVLDGLKGCEVCYVVRDSPKIVVLHCVLWRIGASGCVARDRMPLWLFG
ncbi:unnamed protein product [Durusdinium trenchii]|uniref:Uncharacterized protein n=1 Tax=Durusdinium trenchii TaxID=1381693 RepID=A0ABP0JW88_9DINO